MLFQFSGSILGQITHYPGKECIFRIQDNQGFDFVLSSGDWQPCSDIFFYDLVLVSK